ncbi:cysteine methyltransferase [Pseudoalteromonas luteoviolacea]|uniref:Methylated-DNA--protein-cysteine methyltransferase n=1 Tax=Pseudoalteromonas luteoviolacea TaxID=43657 RepID=A0A1C0TM93_9GAMM|nr:methylated-DNA--[protein]-cysteine S-methyltransferase [Pseudoalteromonas luteoviolacea]MBQ4812234.1 methylated-DNA--[protein]-cysteine S-methyltransferase [Pseudoalteromonas luteoviolacea]OCQ20014.1 cysteine methyltransferase [Pseudoalteromonas luteoviolacea]
MNLYTDYFQSPLGLIEIKASEIGIRQLIFCGEQITQTRSCNLLKECNRQLDAYFSGNLTQFDLDLDWQGTPFQQQVWQALTEIPFGKSMTYLELAEQLNNPKAVRAVGGANGRNPITLIVPCHRVIGANGKLTGYAGGVTRKQWLLAHEGIMDIKPSTDELALLVNTRQAKTEFLQ